MANPEHLKLLKRGVDAWNKWRKGNPGIKPNFEGAYLKAAGWRIRASSALRFSADQSGRSIVNAEESFK
jgi:hypothetical protein